MRSYKAIFLSRFFTICQYRSAALAGLTTQLFWGLLKMMILTAFFAETQNHPIALSQTITFIWLGQALLQLLPWSFDKELEAQVKSGNVLYELIRPLDLYGLWFFRSLAMRVVPALLRCTPIFVLAGLFFELQAPVSSGAFIAFLAAIGFGALLSAAITTFVMITLFWTISGEGLMRLMPHTVMLLSGLVVPLPLFPEWLQPALNLQPFRGIIDIPCRLYTGVIPVQEAFPAFGFQIAWIIALVAIGRLLMKLALKRVVIQGG